MRYFDGTEWAQGGSPFIDYGPGSINGLAADVYLPVTDDDERNGIVIKIPGPSWGIGQDYGEGQAFMVLNEADSGVLTSPTPILKTITATTNATPVQVTTSSAHGLSTGDIVLIYSNAISAITDKWWKITVIDATNFTLDNSTAPGSTSSAGNVFTDRSPVMFRMTGDGAFGFAGGMHVAVGLRGRQGQARQNMGVWIDPSVDANCLVIHNPLTTEWVPTPVGSYILAADVRSSPARNLFDLRADGELRLRRQAGKADGGTVFSIRNDADSANAMWLEAGGQINSSGWIVSEYGEASQTQIGDVFGFAGIAMGSSRDTAIIRTGVGVISLYNVVEMTEFAQAAAPAANKGILQLIDNGAGKTQLVIRFNTGAVQVIATQP